MINYYGGSMQLSALICAATDDGNGMGKGKNNNSNNRNKHKILIAYNRCKEQHLCVSFKGEMCL